MELMLSWIRLSAFSLQRFIAFPLHLLHIFDLKIEKYCSIGATSGK